MPETPPVLPAHGVRPPRYRMPEATHLGQVRLQVADVARSVAYYRDVIGLRVLSERGDSTTMAAHDDPQALLDLVELKGAAPVPPRGRLGLFHVAILLPDRAALGRFVTHLANINERAGMSDHFVSEAIYLTDPDGLGLEIYADRPREMWETHGQQLAMVTEPLDASAVVQSAHGIPWTGAPAGTTIGHVHLHVGNLEQGAAFYHEGLGFDKTVWDYPGALFLAAGGYHHHVGTNTWTRTGESARANEARLLEWEIVVPHASDVQALQENLTVGGFAFTRTDDAVFTQDPWGTRVRIRASLP